MFQKAIESWSEELEKLSMYLFTSLVQLLITPTAKHWCLMMLIFSFSFAETHLQS